MEPKKIVLSVMSLMAFASFQSAAQSSQTQLLLNEKVQGVPVMFGSSMALAGMADGNGLTHGTGQFGAETVSACFYDYRTKIIANYPANISSGWIITNQKSNPSCIPPGGLPQPNWQEMTYFLTLPIGTTLQVCWAGNTWPATWTPTSYAKNPNLCGYYPSGVNPNGQPNVMYIRRDS